MINKPLTYLIGWILLTLSCKETTEDRLTDGLNLYVGEVCGWCVGQDELGLSQGNFSYYYYAPCDSTKDVPLRFFANDDGRWRQVTSQLNLQAFAELDLQTCNECVDGCDYWIRIVDGDFEHEIRFGQVDQIENEQLRSLGNILLQELEDARSTFRK